MQAAAVRVRTLDQGQLVLVRLDGPPANVIDLACARALRNAVVAAGSDPRAKAIVFEGEGKHFSYGASVEDHLPDRVGEFLREFHGLFRDLLASELPLVACVSGRCLGGGLELAAFCQRVIAAPGSEFAAPEITLGVFAPVASLVLPMRVRQPVADELLLTGRTFTVEPALACGLVDEIVEHPGTRAIEWTRERLLPRSATALRHATRAARAMFAAGFLAALDQVEKQYLDELMRTHDAVEGVRAFLEKRAPRFGG